MCNRVLYEYKKYVPACNSARGRCIHRVHGLTTSLIVLITRH